MGHERLLCCFCWVGRDSRPQMRKECKCREESTRVELEDFPSILGALLEAHHEKG